MPSATSTAMNATISAERDDERPDRRLRADPVVVAVVRCAMRRSLPDVDGIVFVEIPSGSRNKYEWDDEAGGIVLDRRLFTSMSYPADYGFVEGTLAEDGDPLDALVLVGEPTFPGCRIRVRAVGVFHMADEKGPDEKVLCVPLNDPSWSSISDIHDVPPQLRNEIEHFFQVYKDLEDKKKTETRGFGNRAEAQEIISACRRRVPLVSAESCPGSPTQTSVAPLPAGVVRLRSVLELLVALSRSQGACRVGLSSRSA